MDYREFVSAPSDPTLTDAAADAAPDADDSIEAIAGAWLAAEQSLAAGSGNPAQSEIDARALSDRYDEAIRTATREDLRLAWEAARKIQADQEMGSEAWANARRLSELLRGEYQAAAPIRRAPPRSRPRPRPRPSRSRGLPGHPGRPRAIFGPNRPGLRTVPPAETHITQV